MGTEEILVTEFQRYVSPGYSEMYKKNCSLSTYSKTLFFLNLVTWAQQYLNIKSCCKFWKQPCEPLLSNFSTLINLVHWLFGYLVHPVTWLFRARWMRWSQERGSGAPYMAKILQKRQTLFRRKSIKQLIRQSINKFRALTVRYTIT